MKRLLQSVYSPYVNCAWLIPCNYVSLFRNQSTTFASTSSSSSRLSSENKATFEDMSNDNKEHFYSSQHQESHEMHDTEDSKTSSTEETTNSNNNDNSSSTEKALGKASDVTKRNFVVWANTTKAVYVHPINHISSWYWFTTETHKWFVGAIVIFIGTQMFARYRIAKAQTAAQAQLGENLLDQRTRDLLSDIETLRKKDPLRLEHEANYYHEQFWKRRAKTVSESRNEVRKIEIERGLLQGEARGTDMTEWLGAKAKDEEEREIARRTQDYIQGFHQHLKAKRLI